MFGERVLLLRRRKKLTQERLAAATGLHRTVVGEIERGQANPSLVTVVLIARALTVPLAELLDGIMEAPT